MKSSYVDLIYKFQNKWIAVDNKRSKIIAAAKSIDELSNKVKGSKEKNIIFSYIIPENRTYSPICRS